MAVIRNALAPLRAVDGVLQRLGPVLLAAHCLKHALITNGLARLCWLIDIGEYVPAICGQWNKRREAIGVCTQCAGVSRDSCAEIAPCSAFTVCGDLTALYQLCN